MRDHTIHLFVPYIGAFGGVEKLIGTLIANLRNQGRDSRLLCFGNTLDFAVLTGGSVDVRALAPRRNFLSEVASLRRYLHDFGDTIRGRVLVFDLKSAGYFSLAGCNGFVLHVDDPPSLLPTDVSKYAWSAFGKAACPDLLPDAGFLIRARGELLHRLISRGVRRASSTIATTERPAAELECLYGIKCSVVNLGVRRRNSPVAVENHPTDPFWLLSVCRLEKNKRIDWILDALAILEERPVPLSLDVNWRLRIVGEGSEMAGLKARCQSLGLGDRVTFSGFVSDDALEVMYQQAGLFVMPAKQGFGIPALEALEREVPVVMNRDSRVSEVLSGSKWVEIVEDGPDALAEGMRSLIHRIAGDREGLGPPPQVKGEEQWCEEIAELCGWGKNQNRPPEC